MLQPRIHGTENERSVQLDTLLKYIVLDEKREIPEEGLVLEPLSELELLLGTRKKYYVLGTNYVAETEDPNYQAPKQAGNVDYLFVPRGLVVNRVPAYELGQNVLGRTWPGTGFIEVLDTLQGEAFEEVLQHEINHNLYPHENEREIRERTRRQLRNPVFH